MKEIFRRLVCRYDDNTKVYFKETDWEGVQWIHVAHAWKGIEIWGFYEFRVILYQFSDC